MNTAIPVGPLEDLSRLIETIEDDERSAVLFATELAAARRALADLRRYQRLSTGKPQPDVYYCDYCGTELTLANVAIDEEERFCCTECWRTRKHGNARHDSNFSR